MTRGAASTTSAPLAAVLRRRWSSFGMAAAGVVSWAALGGCGKDGSSSRASPSASGPHTLASAQAQPATARSGVAPPIVAPIPPHTAAELTPHQQVGRSIFFDQSLSTPPGTSCSSCHDPDRAFSGNHGSTTGVAQGSRPGHFARRNTPSVLYLKYVPAFHFALEDDDDLEESPFGGVTWNGRVDTVAEFSRLPLFDPDEMNNKNEAELAGKLRSASYAPDLEREFPGALASSAAAVHAVGEALQAFLTSDAMSPFSSKFDDYLRGKVQLSPLEMKGLNAFENRAKGDCRACHEVHAKWNRPEASLFTKYSYDAVAVPRNRMIAANADPNRYDLGLCERKGKAIASSDAKWCGLFRVPSLRNVAVRERWMHNGVFSKLREAVEFYATRATNPSRWYPPGAKFDDLPARHRGNVNQTSLPYHLHEGAKPVLDDDDIDAIVAFLATLTDEPYRPR